PRACIFVDIYKLSPQRTRKRIANGTWRGPSAAHAPTHFVGRGAQRKRRVSRTIVEFGTINP
ncbi:MAG TPA: hypothetical protein VEK73_04230, partial [Xanthobacteraceae bacterium]|nr:hypothetical protein [Xanthobacteraceae bacterium]